ncbi:MULTISPECIES: MGMT family protein [unclassified Alteromonas]|uniref:MGMT family protein n=1 Tax=unclassified Alteromonas TaxID=2614992 RepID=UPI001E6222BC|nr:MULTISPECIES: MGMT family protein [unclassified Alteromonas]WDT86137.1 MGMT family protein [Alteromonas sp. 009811495]|tara:strand:- start:85 stop:441 length:357 start_codon:yes stop_codon:yes gene_type:complete
MKVMIPMVNPDVYQRVEKTLRVVPRGVVVSYGQLADLSGLPGRARLIGKCLQELKGEHNWHRVVRADGKIAFPSGSDKAHEQRERLLIEGVIVKNNRISMQKFGWRPDLHTILTELTY